MKSINTILVIVLSLSVTGIVLSSCSENNDTKKNDRLSAPSNDAPKTEQTIAGKKILEDNCYLCHNPSATEKNRIAPPMIAIKSHYLHGNPTKDEFEKSLLSFLQKPSESNAKMKLAVKRFGIMPYQSYPDEDIKKIAEYLYDYKIPEPAWFKKHISDEYQGEIKYNNRGIEEGNSSMKEKSVEEKGMEYAMTTKKELGKNLMGTIQKKGTLAAVEFCNKQAYPITDSMATAQNVAIKRVSDKPRNANNQASTKELGIIEKFKKAVASNEDYEPHVEYVDDKVMFYSPIVTNSMCLQCHGNTDSDIKPEVLTTIKDKYPEDLATGYDVDEVRGIWRITFDK